MKQSAIGSSNSYFFSKQEANLYKYQFLLRAKNKQILD
jgi:hypothetical protein